MQYFDPRDLKRYSTNAKTLVSYFKARSQMPMPPRKRSKKGKQTNMYQRVANRGQISTKPKYSRPDSSMWSGWSSRYGWSGRTFDPFPYRMRCKMRYSDQVQLVTTTGVITPYIFAATSIFDPNVTGTGHQPYGHDTYESLYNHYRVAAAIITVSITTPFNGSVGIAISDDTSITTDYRTIAEIKGCNIVQCSTNSPNGHVRNYYNANYYPDKKNLDAFFGASPTEQMFFMCFVRGDSSTASVTNNVTVSIEYIVDMWEPKDLGQS